MSIGTRPNEAGQALTEFLVVALALIPLFLLIPLIAKYQDISHSTQMASRYAAFDAMVHNDTASTWKPEDQLAEEVRRRFFSTSDAPIKTNDAAGEFAAHRNPFWVDPAGKPLVKQFVDVQVAYGPGKAPTHGQGFEAASDMSTFMLAPQLELRSRGIYTANVTVNLANMPSGLQFHEPFDRINLTMARSTSLLLDPWTAKDPDQVEQKILASPAIFPAGSLAPISALASPFISLIELPGQIPGPKLGRLEFWRDVVPKDRLRSNN